MFKKAKRKIVLTIHAILCSILIATLGLIFISSYSSVTHQNYKVLETHVWELMGSDPYFANDKMVKEDFPPEPGRFSDGREGKERIQRRLKINMFYSVKMLADGSSEVIENGPAGIYSDEELITLAEKVSSKAKGKTSDLLYVVEADVSGTYVCFMDNMVFTDSFSHLLLYTLLFGLLAIGAITILSIRIAERIVAPMEETYLKQKQFTADAGHELKSPIAAMAANIELLEREMGGNKWLENISYENKRMSELVTELLELARNENKTVERKPADLSRLVNGAILPMEASVYENHILLETEIEEGITATIDEKGITQLVTILVDNAVSHTKTAEDRMERVWIRLREAKGHAVFSVTNPGEEIPESERKKLFERFYRADSSHEFSGHYGLGLAIAKAIADAHDAEIDVSCQEGQVTFSVVFPG